MKNAIEISGLCKKYCDFELSDINFALPEGCILGLAGENGAGKSTTIKLIMNTIERSGGAVTVLGVDNRDKKFTDLKNDIGVVLDEAYFPEVLTPKKVCAIMRNTYKNWNDEAFWTYTERFSLPNGKMFKEFSRGMKMKLAIAVALSHEPKLLILDEATSGLDPIMRDEILDILEEFTRDERHSIIFSSHIVSDMEKLCDYVAFMHKGKLTLFDEKDKILSKYAVLKLPKEKFENISQEAVHGVKETPYGIEALVEKEKVPEGLSFEHTTLEDVILFFAREGRTQ